MAQEGSISVSPVEDVLKEQGTRLSDINLASRKKEQAEMRRYEAAGWLRKTVRVGGAKDLPEEPSEEEFRLALRNGIALCAALNVIHPGAIPKVVEASADSALVPDGVALSAYQYFENVRNFLNALEELGLPTFEASDLGQDGKCSRVVNCLLALKSYSEHKQIPRNCSLKSGGVLRPTNSGKHLTRRASEPFTNFTCRSQSGGKVQDGTSVEQNMNLDLSTEPAEMIASQSLNMFVRTILSDKKPEEVPAIIESMLSKVMQEFEQRLASQNESVHTTLKDNNDYQKSYDKAERSSKFSSDSSDNMENEENNLTSYRKEDCTMNIKHEEMSKERLQTTSKDNIDYKKSYDKTERSSKFSSDSSDKMENEENNLTSHKEDCTLNIKHEEMSKERLQKQGIIIDRQRREVQELKDAVVTTRASINNMKARYSEEFNNLGKHFKVLAHAASAYHKVLKDNRKLYNQVQDLKGNIRVYCRVRPALPGQNSMSSIFSHIDDGNITINTPAKYGKEGHRSFSFNKVFGPSASQEEVFSDTQPLIRSVLDGYNICIFAYGQTGSGKTYTMTGPKQLSEETLGVNFRALNDLFQISEERKDTFHYEITVQMIEIYNEQVRDLLVMDGLQKKLEIRTNSQNGLNVPDANLIPVTSPNQVIELMNLGHRNRAVSATAMNDRSSRSHSCLTIHVQGKDLTSGTTLRGCMHLVDLAGSERVNKSEVRGEGLKEATHINKSLSALGDVISALSQKSSHVPYRNSKLTQLLQDSLGGQAKTLMFVHISPEFEAIGETLSTLKFAERVASVELGAARLNKDSGEVKELKEQIASLKAALARNDGEFENYRTMSSPDLYSMKSSNASPEQLIQRQPMEDVGNIENRGNSGMMQKRANFDIQDLLLSNESSPWADSSLRLLKKTDYRGTESEGWLNTLRDNKQASAFMNQESAKDCVGDNLQEPDFSDRDCTKGMTLNGDQQISQANSIVTDDSDDTEITNGDISWQLNVAKDPHQINSGSMIRKPQPSLLKSPNPRAISQLPVPSPSRKMANSGATQISSRTSKQQIINNSVNAKRSAGSKIATRK